MKTQIEQAREGIITPQMAAVAVEEHVSPEYVRLMVAEGKVVIPWNHVCAHQRRSASARDCGPR